MYRVICFCCKYQVKQSNRVIKMTKLKKYEYRVHFHIIRVK